MANGALQLAANINQRPQTVGTGRWIGLSSRQPLGRAIRSITCRCRNRSRETDHGILLKIECSELSDFDATHHQATERLLAFCEIAARFRKEMAFFAEMWLKARER
jgi:hypothetical protein